MCIFVINFNSEYYFVNNKECKSCVIRSNLKVCLYMCVYIVYIKTKQKHKRKYQQM